jgi:glutaredoxin
MQIKNVKKHLIYFCLTLLASLTFLTSFAHASNQALDVYFFYNQACPHCAKQKPLMEYIDKNNQEVKVYAYEVTQHPDIWEEFLEKYKISTGAVPRTFIGEKTFIGYIEEDGSLEYNSVYTGYIGYKNQIIQAIESELGKKINLPGQKKSLISAWQIFFLPGFYIVSYLFLRNKLQSEQAKRYWFGGLIATLIVSIFVFINLTPDTAITEFSQKLPFPLFVSIIAIADGFNPCAFTVLIILLSLLTYTKSKKDMTIVGSTFITTSAVIYFIFIMIMVLLGSIFLERYGSIFMLVLGTIITIAGIINIKDYFFFKKVISLSLSESQQREITRRASQIVRDVQTVGEDKKKFFAALLGTILLAIIVNIVELGCTSILPAVYMTSLINFCIENNWLCYGFWTAIYAAIYIIPLFVILFNFIYSFKSARLTEMQGRNLKLFGGMFMLFFGLIMIFKPEFLIFG